MKYFYQKFNFIQIIYVTLFFELINVFFYLYILKVDGYLPSPFVADKNDTLMDFYNPLFWTIKNEFYSTFDSVYPPINYFLLKILSFGIPVGEVNNAFQLRQAYPWLGIIITVFYIVIVGLCVVMGAWQKIKINKFLIFAVSALSVPVLFGLERGNLIFVALLFLGLYLNSSNPWTKCFYFGLLVNIKPYFIVLLLQYINIYQYDKNTLIRMILSSLIIFFGFSFFADLSLYNFISNYISFSKNTTLSPEGVVSLPHSIAAMSFIKAFIKFEGQSSYTFWFSCLKVANYLTVIALLYLSIIKKLSPVELLIACFLILTNALISTGGYILAIYIVLIPYLLVNEEYKKFIFYILVIYCLPVDWFSLINLNFAYVESYLGNREIQNPDLKLSVGSLIRPITNFLFMMFFIGHVVKKYSSKITPVNNSLLRKKI